MSDAPGRPPAPKISRTIRGIGASPGIAVAPCLVLEAAEQTVFRVAIKPTDVDAEVTRFREAVAMARAQLSHLQEMFEQEHRETAGSIFDAQRVLLEDETLMGAAEEAIRTQRINAEWALRMELHHLTQSFADVPDRDRLLENVEDIDENERGLERTVRAVEVDLDGLLAHGAEGQELRRRFTGQSVIELARDQDDPALEQLFL